MVELSEKRPLVINSYADLLNTVTAVLKDAGVIKEQSEATTYELVSTPIAKKMLKEKGYKTGSYTGFKGVLKANNIEGEVKGVCMWYKRADIEAIPAKR